MSVFNDSFTQSKTELSDQQLVDSWVSSLETFKKHIKYLNTLLQDITAIFENYGKQLQKSGKSLVTSLSKLITPNNKYLSECLRTSGSYSEVLGAVYQKSSSALSSTISSKILKVTETATELKKRISEDSSAAIKDLGTAKLNHMKVKVKYEKAKKEFEQIQNNLNKLKSDPNNSYQPSIIQRAKEKAKNSKKEVLASFKTLNDLASTINTKASLLETILFNINSHTTNFEQEAVELIQEILQLLIKMFKDIVTLRIEQSTLKQEQLSGLANITLDMVGGKETETNSNTLEYLSYKLDSRVNSCEDRLKIIKVFKTYIGEIVANDENLNKSLEKSLKGFVLPEYFEVKAKIKSVWNGFYESIFQVSKLHSSQGKEFNIKVLDPLGNLVISQGNLSKTLQITVQKIIKDHALTHEECLKEYEKLKRSTEDFVIQKRSAEISQKMLSSFQTTENLVLSSLTDNSNVESSHFQLLKVTLINLNSAEEDFNTTLINIVSTSEGLLSVIDVTEDFKDRELYKKKLIPELVSFGEISHVSDSVEDEEETETLNADALLQKCGLKSNTVLIESFSCALSQKLLLQGRLYITNTHIVFHSYFNSSTIFGRETLVSIPLADIIKIEKRAVLFFDNSLCLLTKSGSFLFKSLYYREQAYATLENLLKLNNPVFIERDFNCEIMCETRKTRLDIHKAMMEIKQTDVKPVLHDNFLKYNVLENPLKLEVSPQKVFNLIFSDDSLSFLKEYLSVQGNLDIDISKWDPAIPEYFATGESECFEGICVRTAKFRHPVKDRLPFMPKYCNCYEVHTVFFKTKEEFVVEQEVNVSGVPLSDCFVAYMQYHVKGNEVSEVSVRYGINFLKNTVFRGKIEDSGVSQSKLSIRTVWIPRVTARVSKVSGKVVEPEVEVVMPAQVPAGFDWDRAGIIILAVLVVYFWVRIINLENQVVELAAIVNKTL